MLRAECAADTHRPLTLPHRWAVQLVNQAGWAEGNSAMFVISKSVSSGPGSRVASAIGATGNMLHPRSGFGMSSSCQSERGEGVSRLVNFGALCVGCGVGPREHA